MPFTQNWHELAQDLRKELADSRPLLVPKTPVNTQEDPLDEAFLDSSSISVPVYTIESDSDNLPATPSRPGPAVSRKRGNGTPATPTPQKRVKTLADIPQYNSQQNQRNIHFPILAEHTNHS